MPAIKGSAWLDRIKTLFRPGDDTPSWRERDPNAPLTEQDRFLADSLPFDRIEATGADAWARWRELRAGPGYPVIVGGDDALMRTAEHMAFMERPAGDILAAAAPLTLPNAFDAWRAEQEAMSRAILGADYDQFEEEDPTAAVTVADVPDPTEIDLPGQDGPSVLLDVMSHAPLERAYLLRLPVAHGWEAPVHLRFGGWNDCPPAPIHVAALRDWERRYGAELVTMAGDVVELHVARRPATRAEALALAREHQAYCSDVVERDAEQMALYAASLMVADWWYFWWD